MITTEIKEGQRYYYAEDYHQQCVCHVLLICASACVAFEIVIVRAPHCTWLWVYVCIQLWLCVKHFHV